MIKSSSKIYVAGHRGLTGSAICRHLKNANCENILVRTSTELDLRDFESTDEFFASNLPDYVFLAAARVGGIIDSSTNQAEFLEDNTLIVMNILKCARKHNVKKVLFLGTSCIYPAECEQPMKEDSLMSGPLEPTCEGYALAKLVGIRLSQYYRKQFGLNVVCIMPPNLFGPGDDFRPEYSHFLQGIMDRMHKAKLGGKSEVTIWGTGSPRRELMHVDDMASASIWFMNNYEGGEIVNTGVGEDNSIRGWAELVKEIVGFKGELIFDSTKPDGTKQKLMDSSYAYSLGWKPQVDVNEGIRGLYEWYKTNVAASS